MTKASALPDDSYLHKSEFEIDLEAGAVTCPAGEVAHFAGSFRPGHSTEAVFTAATCGRCPFAVACVQTPGQGRTISIHPYEHQLQAAAERRRQPDFPALMAKRPTIERKQAHLNRKGGTRTRYYGLHKARLQLFWSAAVVNIERLMVIGQAIASLGGRRRRRSALNDRPFRVSLPSPDRLRRGRLLRAPPAPIVASCMSSLAPARPWTG